MADNKQNRTLLNNDTAEEIDKYIDEICSDPVFLCQNKELCGNNTSIYSNLDNVNKICNDIKKANTCEHDFKTCVVSVKNTTGGDSDKQITTGFENIIIPIPNAFDYNGNNKFLRLPPLSAYKKPDSREICSICECMNRFATSPGASTNISTSPGQNQCVYVDKFEYFYYPLAIENINSKLGNTPPVKLGKYNIINSNIIYAHTEEELLVSNLYDLLVSNGISSFASIDFINNVLYKNDKERSKELQRHIKRKEEKSSNVAAVKTGFFYENISFFYILLVVFIVLLVLNLIKSV